MPRRLTTEHFIILCKKKHGEKYDYNNTVYNGSRKKIKYVCYTHGEVTQLSGDHKNGFGCQKCSGNFKYDLEYFKDRSLEVHQNKYNYDKVLFVNYTAKVIIHCNTCDKDFTMTPKMHINQKNGCANCFGTKMHTNDEFIKKCNIKHNELYDYSKCDYKGLCKNIIIICKRCSTEFTSTGKTHLHAGNGCKRCKESKGSIIISDYLNDNNIQYIKEYSFDNCKDKRLLKFDFFLSVQNIIIEFDGEQHFKHISFFGSLEKFKKGLIRDKIKTDYCKNNLIKLIRIPYFFQDRIKDILDYHLKGEV